MELSVEETNRLVVDHLHMVHRLAQKWIRIHRLRRRSSQIDDLVSAGYDGLIEASRRYSPGKGGHFPNFARLRIQGAMIDYVRKDSGFRANKPVVFSSEIIDHFEEHSNGAAPTQPFKTHEAELHVYRLELRKAVEELPYWEKQILKLHFFEELEVTEAGLKLGISKSKAFRSLLNGLRLLRERYEQVPPENKRGN